MREKLKINKELIYFEQNQLCQTSFSSTPQSPGGSWSTARCADQLCFFAPSFAFASASVWPSWAPLRSPC